MHSSNEHREASPAERALTWTVIAVAILALTLLIWAGQKALFILFAAILWAIFLGTLADELAKHLPLSYPLALASLLLCLMVLGGGTGSLLFPVVAAQADQLLQDVPLSLAQVKDSVMEFFSQYRWGSSLAANEGRLGLLSDHIGTVFQHASSAASAALNGFLVLLVVLITGIYLAWQRGLYIRGVTHLVPVKRRERAMQIMNALAGKLWWWLVGRIASMTVVAVLTTVGLWLLNVPLAMTLGLVAGLFAFVPYLGPILSAIPAILLAYVQAPVLSLYVALFYAGVQVVESYIITPLIQQRTVALPPALLISAQVLMGIVFGTWGVVLAAPLTAAALVLVQMLYVADVLGDQSFEQGT